MRPVITVLGVLIAATAIAFNAFMKDFKDGDTKQAIGDHGIDERSRKSFSLEVPGDLTYEIKDSKDTGEGKATITARGTL